MEKFANDSRKDAGTSRAIPSHGRIFTLRRGAATLLSAAVILGSPILNSYAAKTLSPVLCGTSTVRAEEEVGQGEIEELILRFYTNILGREPEDVEMDYWLECFGNGTPASQMAVAFYESDEFRARKMGPKTFLKSVYAALLGRTPEDSEVEYWIGIMDNGATKFYVLSQVIGSYEFNRVCAYYDVAQGGYRSDHIADKNPPVSAFVARMYSLCLDRRYEQEGLNYWVKTLLNQDNGGLEVAKEFFNSEEFLAKESTDENFVTTAYRVFMDREPEKEGLEFWMQKLSSAEMTRNEVLVEFARSDEFRGICENAGIMGSTKDPRYLYPEACGILDQVGWDLRSAYDWSVGITYVRSSLNQDYGTRYLAHLGFTTRKGNCYVYAATFYEQAKALGYDAHHMVGYVKNRYGGLSPHSWVEIDMEGTTYVFDPEFEQTKPGRNGWKFHYGKSETWMYAEYYRLN